MIRDELLIQDVLHMISHYHLKMSIVLTCHLVKVFYVSMHTLSFILYSFRESFIFFHPSYEAKNSFWVRIVFIIRERVGGKSKAATLEILYI